MKNLVENYDIVVVGAGHAGCEAALAGARLGLNTIMFTVSVDSIALMPCNPNVGGSSKGLGAAGITKDEEKARSRALLQEARKRGVKVLVMHIGGGHRRGELTDTFIETVASPADRLIVLKSSNFDGVFTRAKPPSAMLTEVETVKTTVPALQATLREWGVTR